MHGEKLDANHSSADEWISMTLSDVLRRYHSNDIFNADETGLYYRALPNGSHVFKSNLLTGGKMSKERLTLLVTVSMNGKKCPLLVMEKSKNPRWFRRVKNCL